MFDLVFFQFLAHLYMDIGPPKFRRWVLDRVPSAKIQELKGIVDTMDRQSREIFNSKKAAFEQGDEAVARQVGEGKAIMSIMRELILDLLFASSYERLSASEYGSLSRR